METWIGRQPSPTVVSWLVEAVMKVLHGLWIASLLAATCFAQGPRYGFGFGNVVFPGGVPIPRNPFSITNPSFAQSLGGIVSGLNPYTGAARGRSLGRGAATVVVPYIYPVPVGGYYYPDDPVQQPAPNVTVINQAPPTPQVVINQTFAQPDSGSDSTVRVYQAPSPRPAASAATNTEPPIYLIAFKDGTVGTAVAYWLDSDTLEYVTMQGSTNRASLSLVDTALSRRLNRERNVPFQLPGD